jgi:hypothetical protein
MISFLTITDTDLENSIKESLHVPSYLEGVKYKDYLIKLETSYWLYEIQSISGSELPSLLTSKYTSPDTARAAIDTYCMGPS